jgi:hypothetical protein
MLVVYTDEMVRNTTAGLVSIFVTRNDVMMGRCLEMTENGEGWR